MTKIILTVSIILLSLPPSVQVVIFVDSCPSNEKSWTEKSNKFLCSNGHVYHCIQTKEHNLIETCMTATSINADKDGCPWVKIIDGKPYLGNPFKPCDLLDYGCPENIHQKYSTNELYKYPACITSGNITATNETGPITTTPFTPAPAHFASHNDTVIFIIISCIPVLTSICIVIFLGLLYKRQRKKRLQEKDSSVLEYLKEPIARKNEESSIAIQLD